MSSKLYESEPQLIPDGWVFDLTEWNMLTLEEWKTAKMFGDIDTQNDLMSRTIKQWTFSGDPTKVQTYNYLSLAEWGLASTATGNAVLIEVSKYASKYRTN